MIRRWLGGSALLLLTPLVVGACDDDPSGTGAGSGAGADDTVTVGPTSTTTSSTSSSASSGNTGGSGGGGEACLTITEDCSGGGNCCEGLSCDMTSLGEVCCSGHGGPCATLNGEDCCGQLLCSAGTCLDAGEMPVFQAPFPCGQEWTYSHHSQEVRRALDFISSDGSPTNGAPALAAGWGLATQHYEKDGAGNYIAIDHGGGWITYYFHLSSFSVADGTFVNTGDEVGKVGTTGASSGPHLHFEQLLDYDGVDIVIDGQALAPYPSTYGVETLVSNNCPMP